MNKSLEASTQYAFLKQVRSGQSASDDPGIVLARVKAALSAEAAGDERAAQILHEIEQHPDDALALAAHNIATQARTPEEKKRAKQERSTRYYNEWLLKKDVA